MINADAIRAFRDPEYLTVAEWAERELWTPDGARFSLDPVPYVRPILDAYSSHDVEEIVVIKSAQCGFTESLLLPIIAYHIAHDPRDLLVPLPTVEEATKWAKIKLDRLLAANPPLAELLAAGRHRESLLERDWPGGRMSLAGSNSARPFRMATAGAILGDDVDSWARTAGRGDMDEGDQTVLARRRTDRVPDRKLVWVSTPTRNDARIHALYEQMQRRGEWHVPCPECGEMQVLTLRDSLRWEKEAADDDYIPGPGEVVSDGKVHLTDTAFAQCVNGCRIEESQKRWMAERGDYRAEDGEPVVQAGVRRLGFHFHGGLGVILPGGEWPRLAAEFLAITGSGSGTRGARRTRREKLRSFINTSLGEAWAQPSGRPELRRLLEKREPDWRLGQVPDGVELLTAGNDWQGDRAVILVVGWNRRGESWIVDHIVIPGPDAPFNPAVRSRVLDLFAATWKKADGTELPIRVLAADTGAWTDTILSLAIEAPGGRFWPIKGASKTDAPARSHGTRNRRWPYATVINVHEPKHALHAGLRAEPPAEGEEYPEGYVHLPADLPEEVARELVAEEFDRSRTPSGTPRDRWDPGDRATESSDCWVYAYRAAEPLLYRLAQDGDGSRPPAPSTPRRVGGYLEPGGATRLKRGRAR